MPVIYDIGESEGCNLSDQDELLHQEDTDSSTDSEDTPATCSARASLNRESTLSGVEELPKARSPLRDKFDFCLTGLSLSLSATVLTIIYPAYLRSVISTSSSFVAILFPSTGCFVALLAISTLLHWLGCFDGFPLTKCPLPIRRLSRGAVSYAVGCGLVVLAQIPGRVPCHLQDPLKAVVILFALLYYFFFCKKMLGLRKLFAASVLAVGLFIAADYGLCDEFKCRGTQSHLEGQWEARAGWTLLYLTGLGLFTLHFTLTEEHIIHHPVETSEQSPSDSLLSTVSRMVAHSESCDQLTNLNASQDSLKFDTDKCCLLNFQGKNSKKLCILVSLWIQGVTWIFIVISGLLLVIMSNFTILHIHNESIMNITMSGLMCHLPHLHLEKPVHHLVSSLPIDDNKNGNYIHHTESFPEKEDITSHARSKFEHFMEHVHLFNTESRSHIAKKALDPLFSPKKNHKKQKAFENSTGEFLTIDHTKNKNNKNLKKTNKKHKYDKQIHKSIKPNIKDISTTVEPHILLTKPTTLNVNDNQDVPKTRVKRKALESLGIGFKIIHPTISILKDHIITNKMKPNLVGHVILNKTNANIKGHKLAYNQDRIESLRWYYLRRDRNDVISTPSPKTEDKKIKKKKSSSHLRKKNPRDGKHVKSHNHHKRNKRDLNSFKHEYINESGHSVKKDPEPEEIISMSTLNGTIQSNRFSNHVNSDYLYTITKLDKNYCNHIPAYGWTVFVAYTGFAVSSLRFLKLCQSSVFTIAMMTPALPLTGIWWAVFTHSTDGGLIVEPTISGELICALLSLPIILLGLTLLFKAQLNQSLYCNSSKQQSQDRFSNLSQEMNAHKMYVDGDAEYEARRKTNADLI